MYNGYTYSISQLVGHELTNYEANLLNKKNICYRGRGKFFSQQDSQILSHFYACNLEFDGKTFSSAEQMYQYLKSFFCGNMETCEQIMATTDPVKIKHLGSRCSNLKWDQIKHKVMLCIDTIKLRACPEVQRLLNNTKRMPIFEFVRDDFWGIANLHSLLGRDGRGGENFSGKIWQLIRAQQYPDYVLLGDSIVRGIILPKCITVSVPGGTFELLKNLALLFSVLPRKGIILHVGTNDLVDRYGNYSQWLRPQNPNELARIIVIRANTIVEKSGIFVIISPILPRKAEERARKKIATFGQKLLQQQKKRSEKIHILNTHDEFLPNFEKYFSDGLHLNTEGRRRLEIIFTDAIASIEPKQ